MCTLLSPLLNNVDMDNIFLWIIACIKKKNPQTRLIDFDFLNNGYATHYLKEFIPTSQ